MATVSMGARRVIFIYYIKKVKKVSGEYYVNLLHLLNDEVKEKRTHLAKVLFRQDSAHFHTSIVAIAKIKNCSSNYFIEYRRLRSSLGPYQRFGTGQSEMEGCLENLDTRRV